MLTGFFFLKTGWGTRALGTTDTATAPTVTITETGKGTSSHNHTNSEDEKIISIEEKTSSSSSSRYEDEKGALRNSVRRRLNRSPAIPSRDLSTRKYVEEEEEKGFSRRNAKYESGNTHYIVGEDDNYHNRRGRGGYEYEEEDLSHGLQIYHDYLPELSRTPDLENAKPIIRMR